MEEKLKLLIEGEITIDEVLDHIEYLEEEAYESGYAEGYDDAIHELMDS